ncbi:RecX family transcriptional regulator [Weissella halotolerans]|nr:RecX family transcriptional regulator [Weissella halotolerans]
MAKVTSVRQQRRPGRYNIYLDDEYALAVDEKILIQFDLFKGRQLDDTELERVQEAEYEQKAYTKALLYATGQMRSQQQVIRKLRDQDFPLAVIKRVIERLSAANVLDDQLFAETYVRGLQRSHKLGPLAAKQKLREWGVDNDIITDVLTDYSADDERTQLEDKVATLMAKQSRNAHRMAIQKVSQKLRQQGYHPQLIQEALQDYEANHEADPENEWENLDRDGRRAFDRYARYDGYEFTRRVKGALARKGYQFDEIDRWLRTQAATLRDL